VTMLPIDKIGVVLGLLMVHAFAIFVQCVKKGPSQYDDLYDLELKLDVNGNARLRQILATRLGCEEACLSDLLRVVIRWCPVLRRLGMIPLFLYLIALILSFADARGLLLATWSPKPFVNALFIIAMVVHAAYFVLKYRLEFPAFLSLHPRYKNASYWLIVLDIEPNLKLRPREATGPKTP